MGFPCARLQEYIELEACYTEALARKAVSNNEFGACVVGRGRGGGCCALGCVTVLLLCVRPSLPPCTPPPTHTHTYTHTSACAHFAYAQF